MKENPLYVALDEPSTGPGDRGDWLETLRRKLDEAEEKASHPTPMVSADGHLQLIVRAGFDGGDLDRGARLAAALQEQIDATAAGAGPAVKMGMAGDVVRGLAEQHGLIAGMTMATVLTVVAVLAALLLYFRSVAGVVALWWSLTVGTLVAFALTKLAIGHLNIATAFLSSIVVGNGINFGIIFLARYLEERRAGHATEPRWRVASGRHHQHRGRRLAAGTAYVRWP